MVELKVEDKIDYSKLKRIAKTQREIRVGHFDAKEAEIAKKLYFGGASPAYISPRGTHMAARNIPERRYLTDALDLKDRQGLEDGTRRYFEALFVGRGGEAAQQLANKMAQDVRDFVINDNWYADVTPNGEDVIADKGENHPLFDQGTLMKSLVGKVVLHGK